MRTLLLVFMFSVACNGKTTEQTSNTPEQKVTHTVSSVPDTVRYEFATFEEGVNIFKKLNYTHDRWEAGIREIPNIHIMKIPERWRAETSKHLEVKLKKEIFFEIMAPLVLSVNDGILEHRRKLFQLQKQNLSEIAQIDKSWLSEIAVVYKVIKESETVDEDHLRELIERVDIIPISLALAQCADESGWGTSRFAAEGNALFGQWSWGEDAMKPSQQRSGMGNYGLARFDTPLESMAAYIHNLNTHSAYKKLREIRAGFRQNGQDPDGVSLASTLDKYSERGQEYVDELLSIIRVNHLAKAEEAYLKHHPVILLIPIE